MATSMRLQFDFSALYEDFCVKPACCVFVSMSLAENYTVRNNYRHTKWLAPYVLSKASSPVNKQRHWRTRKDNYRFRSATWNY